MPELPEVETIRRQIERKLPLKIISVSYSKHAKSILKTKSFSPENFSIVKTGRYGKVLDFEIDENNHITSRLGMSGSWRIQEDKITAVHTHIQFKCSTPSGQTVYLGYIDPRRFGAVFFINDLAYQKILAKLGPDVLTKNFNLKYLWDLFQRFPNKEIKSFLLDQKYFCGIGNYMASEICFLAGVLPTRKTGKISKDKCKKMIKGCKDIIKKNIKSKGLTFHGGYVDAHGEKGEGVKNLFVFNQKICGRCKGEVKKVAVKGRGTYYCSTCQK